MKMTVDVNLDAAFEQLDGLQERVGEKIRWAAWQGVELLRAEMMIQAPRSSRRHYFYSKGSKNADGSKRKYLFEPGDLRKSIFAFYDKNQSGAAVAVYQVGWRHNATSKAKFDGSGLRAVPYGYMVHNGVARKNGAVAGTPFTQKAWNMVGAMVEQNIIRAVKDVADGKITG